MKKQENAKIIPRIEQRRRFERRLFDGDYKLHKIKNAKNKSIGSAKGVETLFRNAYRAELDLIALAATKANIMISLNALIVSALMISDGLVYVSTPLFFVPTTLFLFTSSISIYFALLAASPQLVSTHSGFFSWAGDFIKGKTDFRNFKDYIKPDKSFIEGQSNILIFTDRAKLSKADYLTHMQELLTNQEQVYESMSEQLYWLGMMTHKKFRMLNISYRVFRWGLILSVLAFLFVKYSESLMPMATVSSLSINNIAVEKFKNIYEPSAVQQLPDGRLLIVEDEPLRPLNIVKFLPDGSLFEDTQLSNNLTKSFHRKLSDLEGLAMDSKGYVYVITSHSRNHKGKRKKSREQMLRFKIAGNKVIDSSVYTGLTDQLIESGILEKVSNSSVSKNASFHDINIEALSFDKEEKKLLLGFRAPLIDGKSMIVTLENPIGIFKHNEQPRLADQVTLLDLSGGGIRSLDYDRHLGTYLIANEIEGEDGKKHSQLWSWSGTADQKPQKIDLPEISRMKNVEAIAPVTVNGEARIFVASDNGKIKKKRAANYMLLEYGQPTK